MREDKVDSNKYIQACEDLTFTQPKSDWSCDMFGKSMVFSPAKGDVPCWFHRLMQRIWLGFKWQKVL